MLERRSFKEPVVAVNKQDEQRPQKDHGELVILLLGGGDGRLDVHRFAIRTFSALMQGFGAPSQQHRNLDIG
jgi:hypothetical protein